MMMPANYSAIAANEMTYVAGGSIVDYLVPTLTESNWKTFNTNLVKIIGNSYVNNYVKNTLGVVFSGSYTPGQVVGGWFGRMGEIMNPGQGSGDETFGVATLGSYALGALNVGLNIVGNAAAIYNLGFGEVTNLAGKTWTVKGGTASYS